MTDQIEDKPAEEPAGEQTEQGAEKPQLAEEQAQEGTQEEPAAEQPEAPASVEDGA